METLNIGPTRHTPAIVYEPDARRLRFEGESYPENAAQFYEPIFAWLQKRLQDQPSPLSVDVTMNYFNSSSSKALLDIFDMLDQAAGKGMDITVNWRFHEDNDIGEEYGEEFSEDMQHLTFNLVRFSE